MEKLLVGQNAVLKFDRQPSTGFQRVVAKIEEIESNGEAPAVTQTAQGPASSTQEMRPVAYRVVFAASSLPSEITSGSVGRVRISVTSSSAYEKLMFLASQWWQ